ncbi:hypothetical protein PEC301296_29510 [Pectobacterium carotovorum subsp. carotovorum]|nr:hypothetical protein PEC301296_29510 [Pectobacterium carotovorum subsp. carotovorum]
MCSLFFLVFKLCGFLNHVAAVSVVPAIATRLLSNNQYGWP